LNIHNESERMRSGERVGATGARGGGFGLHERRDPRIASVTVTGVATALPFDMQRVSELCLGSEKQQEATMRATRRRTACSVTASRVSWY